MYKHHHCGEQEPRRIGDVLPGTTRGGPVDGLKHGATISDVGRAGQANRTGERSRHVRENITIQIGQYDHIECLRRVGEFCRADINDPGFVGNIGIIIGNLAKDAVEESIGQLHDVVFHETGDLLAVVTPGILEGVTDNLFAARSANELEALDHIVGLAIFYACVEVLFILTNDNHVHIWVQGFDKGVIGNAGTYIRIESKHRTGRDVEAFVTSALRRGNRSFKKYSGAAERFPGAGFDSRADTTEVNFLAYFDWLDFNASACRFDDVEGGFHNFWSNAISISNCNGYFPGHMTIFPLVMLNWIELIFPHSV